MRHSSHTSTSSLSLSLSLSFNLLLLLQVVLIVIPNSPLSLTVTASSSSSSFQSFHSTTPLAFQAASRKSISTASILFSTKTPSSSSSSASKSSSADIMKTIPLTKLTNFANSYAAANGLQVETKKPSSTDSTSSSSSSSSSSYQCAPISLLPNIFPSQSFHKAKSLAPHFNLLVDKISRNGTFLNDTLAGGKSSVIDKDAFTNNLLKLYNDIYSDNEKHNDDDDDDDPNFALLADRLGIQRSDYMLNPIPTTSSNKSSSSNERFELKQVELNTIASSFAGLAVNVANLHSTLTSRFKNELSDWIAMNTHKVMGEDYVSDTGDTDVGVPSNPALERLPFAMKVAHDRYLDRFANSSSSSSSSEPPVAVLFIVQDGETNTVDQRMLEFKLWEEHNIPVVRMSLTKAHTQLKLDADNGSLYILGDDNDNDDNDNADSILYQVSLVYYRAGYAPTDYPDGDDGIEWKSRGMIERSKATKCPSLGYHLAGTKKVQQELARPGVLEQFFESTTDDDDNDDDEEIQKTIQNLRESFAGLYSLGDDAVQEDYDAVKNAISGSEGKYVLKPQREGGGYNYYGERLAAKIQENISEEDDGSLVLGEDLAEFILMQRLFPPKQRAVLLRAGIVEGSGESISEFGCFGTILQSFDGDTTLHNEYSGFLLRTKFENVDEGGVASGFATLSSPYLV